MPHLNIAQNFIDKFQANLSSRLIKDHVNTFRKEHHTSLNKALDPQEVKKVLENSQLDIVQLNNLKGNLSNISDNLSDLSLKTLKKVPAIIRFFNFIFNNFYKNKVVKKQKATIENIQENINEIIKIKIQSYRSHELINLFIHSGTQFYSLTSPEQKNSLKENFEKHPFKLDLSDEETIFWNSPEFEIKAKQFIQDLESGLTDNPNLELGANNFAEILQELFPDLDDQGGDQTIRTLELLITKSGSYALIEKLYLLPTDISDSEEND